MRLGNTSEPGISFIAIKPAIFFKSVIPMKARRNLYIILGALTTFFYFGGLYMLFTVVKRVTPSDIQSANYNLITSQLWLVIAVLLFRAAYRIQQKINQQKRQALENAFAD